MLLILCRLLLERKRLKLSWGDGSDFSSGSCPHIQLSYQLPMALSFQPLGGTSLGVHGLKENPGRASGVYALFSHFINSLLPHVKVRKANNVTNYLSLDLKCNWLCQKGSSHWSIDKHLPHSANEWKVNESGKGVCLKIQGKKCFERNLTWYGNHVWGSIHESQHCGIIL